MQSNELAFYIPPTVVTLVLSRALVLFLLGRLCFCFIGSVSLPVSAVNAASHETKQVQFI